MLPIDVQAELIQSFQQEKRQRFLEKQGQQQATRTNSNSLRTRILRASGNALIAAGQSMQRAAGAPLTTEKRLGWEK